MPNLNPRRPAQRLLQEDHVSSDDSVGVSDISISSNDGEEFQQVEPEVCEDEDNLAHFGEDVEGRPQEERMEMNPEIDFMEGLGMENDEGVEAGDEESHVDSDEEPEVAYEDDSEVDELEVEEDGAQEYDDGDDPGFDPPLYRGAPITLAQSLLLILSFATVHCLTSVALADLLGLIAFHCMDVDKKCKATLYHFRKYFLRMKSPIKFHYFCSCFSPLPDKNSLCDECGDNTKVCYFIEIPVIAQLQKMLNREGFYHNLGYRGRRIKKNQGSFEDLYDGYVYREKVASGEIRGDTITFCWNTDGVKIFKSTSLEIWPVYLSINELPYRLRFRKENCLIAGIWCGPSSKPKVSLFLKAFEAQLTQLFHGVEFTVHGREAPVRLRGFILCGTCDLPAKACFLNWNSHSGYYSCHKCTIRGEKSERTQFVMAFPPTADIRNRTMEGTDAHAAVAEQFGVKVYGVKGSSDLKQFVPDYIRSTSIDVMHCVWEGVVKKLTHLWFDETYKNCHFSLFNVVDHVSHILMGLTPPGFIRRMPRSLSEHLAYWKAQEFKSFLLYYSIPILAGIMTEPYFNHHLLLVHAIVLLNQTSISPQMIEEAEICLSQYVHQFPYLYHVKFLSLNFHLLLHLGEVVRELGPLWATSCMPYENLNGLLKKLVHGTHSASLQISSGLSQAMAVPVLLAELPEGDPIKSWCNKLFAREHIKISENISDNLSAVGKYTYLRNLGPVIAAALLEIDLEGAHVCQFPRLKKGRLVLSSHSYSRQSRAKSSVVKFINRDGSERFGEVYTYLRISDCYCNVVCRCHADFFAVIHVFNTVTPYNLPLQPPRPISHVMHLQQTHTAVAVPVENLMAVCVCLIVHGNQFVIDVVNTIEDE